MRCHDYEPFEQVEPVGADAGQVEPVLQDAEEQGPNEGPQHRSSSSGEGCSADDGGHNRGQHDVEAIVARVHAHDLIRSRIPMKPDAVAMIMKHQTLTHATRIPASAAARLLPPVAVTCKPKRVCLRRNQIASMMAAQLPIQRLL